MTNEFYLKTQKFFSIWYPMITSICLLNILLHLFFNLEDLSVIYIPFIHCFLIFAFGFYVTYKEEKETPTDYRYLRNSSEKYIRTEDGKYIFDHHPEIWEELVKHKPLKIDLFAFTKFKQGGYDDGRDERLNLIKEKEKYITFIFIYPFLLLLISSVLGILIM